MTQSKKLEAVATLQITRGRAGRRPVPSVWEGAYTMPVADIF